jgi:hypothetical protein
MRVLIAICSWVGAATNGENQAMRDTFLTDVPRFPGLEYKFFVGDGTPTGEDESAMFASYDWSDPGYKLRATASMQSPKPPTYVLKDDEVVLSVPDDYAHLAYKMRGEFRWALKQDFDYTFQIGSDIYIDLQRLMSSGFESHNYVGKTCGNHPMAGGHYAGGGGYWLSKKALRLIADGPVTFWAEDLWVGSIMNKNGIPLHIDPRYAVDYPPYPRRDNEIISAHLGPSNPRVGRYDPQLMYEVHRLSKESYE